MSLYSGMPGRRARLEGPERALDALIGLVILAAELTIGLLSALALYEYGLSHGSNVPDHVQLGFGIAVLGGGAIVIITTLIYLGRVIVGRRSARAPLWGGILMSAAMVIGWFVMSAGRG